MNFCLAKINKRFCVSLILDISGRYLDMSQFGQQYTKERLGAMPASSALSSLLPPPSSPPGEYLARYLLSQIYLICCQDLKSWGEHHNHTATAAARLQLNWNWYQEQLASLPWQGRYSVKLSQNQTHRNTDLMCLNAHWRLAGWWLELCCDLLISTREFLCWDLFSPGRGKETCSAWGAGRLDWHNVIDVMMGMMEDVRHHSGGPMISLKIIIHDVYDFMFIFHYKL